MLIYVFRGYRDGQKQHSVGVLIKRWSENMEQVYRKTPMPKCDFKKVAKQVQRLSSIIPTRVLENLTSKDLSNKNLIKASENKPTRMLYWVNS